ncbi:hypothetical protein JCM10212_004903, partial [Sporobolomyces blumeae]
TTYAKLEASTSNPPTFLSYLTSRYRPDGPHATVDRVRLKAILFLSTSNKYDVEDAKRELEELERNGSTGLTLERIVVYGKLKLDRIALSLLVNVLRDVSSAETYALHPGEPLLPGEMSEAAMLLQVPLKRARTRGGGVGGGTTTGPLAVGGAGPKSREDDARRRRETLARTLVEMCFAGPGLGRPGEDEGRAAVATDGSERDNDEDEQTRVRRDKVAKVLETQAINLDPLEVLSLVPDSFPLDVLSPFIGRSLRRSVHASMEGSVLKHLASGQNLAVSQRWFERQARVPPVVERGDRSTRNPRVREKAHGKKEEEEEEEEEKELEGGEKPVIEVVPTGAISFEDAVELDLR